MGQGSGQGKGLSLTRRSRVTLIWNPSVAMTCESRKLLTVLAVSDMPFLLTSRPSPGLPI